MGIAKLLGLVLLVGGAIALYFGFNATESLGEQVVEGVTGRFTDDTMTFETHAATLHRDAAALFALFNYP